MNRSYEYWENQFLDDIAIKYGFDDNHYLAFKQKLLLKNITLSNSELLTQIDNEQGGNNYFPSNMIADSWNKKIYPTLEKHGFQEKRSVENVRKWLRFDVFDEYIKDIKPETPIELWQELWTIAENSPNNSLQIIPKK